MDAILGAYCGVEWRELPEVCAPLDLTSPGTALACQAIPLSGELPRYSRQSDSTNRQSVALEFTDEHRGVRLLVAPDVAAVTPELAQALERADAVFFDGTFWSDDELRRIDPAARTASQMGHLPIARGSLEILRKLRAPTRVYLHINNTNPILAPDSAERAEVVGAGITIGEDHMEFEL